MDPMYSGLLLMAFGAFFVGGAISFRQQKLPVAVQVILWILGLGVFGYGVFILFNYT